MRRLARSTLNALTVLSLLLCVATGFVWWLQPSVGRWQLVVEDFQIWATSTRGLDEPGIASLPDYTSGTLGFVDHADHGPPAALRQQFNLAGVYTRIVELPLWPLAVAWILIVWRVVSRALMARRERIVEAAGLCPGCGYDLRATPAQCPECGQAAAADAPAAGAA